MKPVSSAGNAGFSLVEAIGYLVATAALMGALTYAMASLFQTEAQPEVSYGGQSYELAPSFSDFRSAIDLHAAFASAVDQADGVVVLGGTRTHPDADPNGPSSALAMNFSDTTLPAAVGSDPAAGFSSWDQLQLNAGQFAPYLTANPDPADFTILTVQGQSRVTSITQQRRHTATIRGQSVVLYEVTHQTVDWSGGSGVLVANGRTGANPTYGYRTYYDAREDTWAQPPGATHYWFRADRVWDRDQEGPTRVIFSDPYALAGKDASAQIAGVSRFSYFLPQVR